MLNNEEFKTYEPRHIYEILHITPATLSSMIRRGMFPKPYRWVGKGKRLWTHQQISEYFSKIAPPPD